LAGIDEEQLRQQPRTESDAKAVKRLTSAVLYKQGNSPAEIERLLGFREQTVYDWLDTVAERDLTALGDLSRPGQSTRLTDDQWRKLTATLGVVCISSEPSSVSRERSRLSQLGLSILNARAVESTV
jgi:hypothetical protein